MKHIKRLLVGLLAFTIFISPIILLVIFHNPLFMALYIVPLLIALCYSIGEFILYDWNIPGYGRYKDETGKYDVNLETGEIIGYPGTIINRSGIMIKYT